MPPVAASMANGGKSATSGKSSSRWVPMSSWGEDLYRVYPSGVLTPATTQAAIPSGSTGVLIPDVRGC
eukprot:4930287-Alexandrium_andersonii.AAC.1